MKIRRDHVIGIDCSTTAVKAIVWSRRGRLVAEGRVPLSMLRPCPTWHEQPADEWWSATVRAVRNAASQIDPRRIAALCLAPQRETFVPVDADGRPLRPAILWMDERCRQELPRLDQRCGASRIHAITGKPLSGNLWLGKIAWLATHEPKLFTRTHMFADVHAFLAHRLTGHFRTSWGCADPTGLFDMRRQEWAQGLLAAIGLEVDRLPELHPPGTVIGELNGKAAAAFGLPPGLPLVAGVGDGQAAGLGAGVTRHGLTYLNLGTAVVSGTCVDKYVTDRAFRTMIGAVPRTYVLETVLLGGAYTIRWFVEKFANAAEQGLGRSVERMLDATARSVAAGANGLLVVPYWNGVLNPYWDAAASGIVVGWRGVHDRRHFYRAILEGIAFELRLHTEGMEIALCQPVAKFIAMGGGARSRLLCQIIADVTGRPVYRSATPEATALGAGILAASAAGLHPNVRAAADAMTRTEATCITPEPQRHALYSRLYEEVYRHLFPTIRSYLDRLTSLSETETSPLPRP